MEKHRLRAMTSADLDLVLRWRNHPEVRRFMYTSHEISLTEHREWFFRASENPGVNLLIYECDNQALGFVNITRGRSSKVADWGFYISPDAPKGTGRSLGEQALSYAFDELGCHKLCGQAIGFNDRSIAFHKALGFFEEGRLRDHHFDGRIFHDVLCFGLLKHEWSAKVEELSNE